MKKKGFTLIELLAVIVILAVIALIATPLVMNVINDARKNSFKDSAYGIMKAVEMKVATVQIDNTNGQNVGYKVDVTGNGIDYEGDRPDSGWASVDVNGVVTLYMVRGEWCAYKNSTTNEQVVISTDTDDCDAMETIENDNTLATLTENGNNGGNGGGQGTSEDSSSSEGSGSSGGNTSNKESINTVNIGDYIHLVPDASSYTIVSSVTGSAEQTISPSELSLWRVISVNSDGTVDAVSEYVSSTGVTFEDVRGYANFVGGLQTIAAQYAKSGYTSAARIIGYDGQTLTIQDTSEFSTKTSFPNYISTPNDTETGQEYNGGNRGDTLYLKDYDAVRNVYGDLKAMKVNTSDYAEYWISSRYYSYFNSGGRISKSFNGRLVTTSGNASLRSFRSYERWQGEPETGFKGYARTSAIRPILTISEDVLIDSGQGTKEIPYELTK